MSRRVIPGMLEAGGGAITNVSSSAGVFGQAYLPGYAASKGGVSMLSRAMAWEYVKRGIGVEFPEDRDNELRAKSIAPGHHTMSPDDPAGLIAFLSSDEARMITGTVIPIDHGITC